MLLATAFCRMFQTSIHSFSGTLSTRLLFVVQLLLSHIQLSHPMDCMGCSILGFPVLHHLLEPAQTHIHWVGDAIQPSCPVLSPSPPTFSLSQHQGLYQWVGSSHQVSQVLELQPQHQSLQWIFRIDYFRIYWFDLLEVQVSLKSLLQQHSSKHQFFSPQVSLWSSSHIHTWTAGEKKIALIIWTFV